MDCTAFGYEAKNVLDNLKKGVGVTAEGRLELNKWTSEDGGKREKIRLVVNRVHGPALWNGNDEPDAA